MLSLKPLANARQATKYFLEIKENYYLSEANKDQLAVWHGNGAKALGLSGNIDNVQFERILEGKLPNNETIGLQKDGTIKHRPGFDLTFSAPKSVSLLTMLGDPELSQKLDKLHDHAILVTLKEIEKKCAQARILKEDGMHFENTNNLVVGMIKHHMSRELDPQLHSHCVVANVTQRSDGKWRALASSMTKTDGITNGFYERVLENQIYFGMIYHSELACGLKELGFDLERTGKNGLFEIKDIPKEVLDVFSKRREQIEGKMAEKGVDSLKAADYATLDTRKAKQNVPVEEQKKVWQEELKATGFSIEQFIANIKNKTDQPLTLEQATINAKEAVKNAIDHLSGFNVKLDYTKIVSKAVEFGIGINNHVEIIKAVDEAIKNEMLITVDRDKSVYTTKELLNEEQKLLDHVVAGKQSDHSIKIKMDVLDKIDASDQQKQIIQNILNSCERINVIEYLGDDQKQFLSALLNVTEHSNKVVRILTANRFQANSVNENIQRQSQGFWQWIVNQFKPEVADSVAGFNFRHEKELNQPLSRFSNGTNVIFVDAAQSLGNSDAQKLLELTQKSATKVILLHNTMGQKGLFAGNPLAVLKKADVETFRLSRATCSDQRSIQTDIKSIKDDQERIDGVAAHYAGLDNTTREKTCLIAGSKTHVDELNLKIREELKNNGAIGRLEHSFTALIPAHLSNAERNVASQYKQRMIIRMYEDGQHKDWRVYKTVDNWLGKNGSDKNEIVLVDEKNKYLHFNPKTHKTEFQIFTAKPLTLAENDKIITAATMRQHGFKAGQLFTVTAVTSSGIKVFDGKKHYSISKNDLENSHFDYNYATTISKTDNKVKDHVVASFKAYSLNQPTMNELTGRAGQSMVLFTDNKEVAQKRLDHVPQKVTAIDAIIEEGVKKDIDRLINPQAIEEIKQDIDKALAVLTKDLSNENKAEKAASFAIAKLSEKNAAFSHAAVVSEALDYALTDGAVKKDDIVNVLKQKELAGELVIGRFFSDGTRWTTQEAIDLENSIINTVKNGRDKETPLIESEKAIQHLSETKLTKGQQDAAYLITTTKDRFTIIQGHAGTGKSTMLGEVTKMLPAEKQLYGMLNEVTKMLPAEKQLYGLAPTHQAVKELKDRGIESQTLKSFLIERQNNADDKFLANKVFVLDEASMVSNRDFAQFVEIIDKNNARAVFIGDKEQHLAIESGKPVEILQTAKATSIAYMTDIVRQQNQNLKEAVYSATDKNFNQAYAKINAENPSKYIQRSKDQDFHDLNVNSIIEIDNTKLEDGAITLEEHVAHDYTSRTSETRDNTAVIVHANDDREKINHLIREELKKDNAIDNNPANELTTNRLRAKNISKGELRDINFYAKDNIVKIGKEYFTVASIDKSSKSAMLSDQQGKSEIFVPEKMANKRNPEIYENVPSALAKGDLIRLKKTDKERGLIGNTEYKITDIKDGVLTLINPTEKHAINLKPHELKDAHWDYAYTVTSHGVQGASKKFVIAYELSYRKNLTNQRSSYIDISRPVHHITIYTDNKEELLKQIQNNRGDKASALETIGQLPSSANEKKTNYKKYRQTKNQDNNVGHQAPRIDAKQVEQSLKERAEDIIESLLGERNKHHSNQSNWRYGNKGSLSIIMSGDKRGTWNNFETGEKGNMLTLIKNELNLSFKDALYHAAKLTGYCPDLSIAKEKQRSSKPHNEKVDQKAPEKNNKTSEYAQKLAKESVPIKGTLAEKYLRNIRKIINTDVSDLRFHPRVYSAESKSTDKKKNYHPALLAVARDKEGNVQSAQAIYLNEKTAEKANLEVKKRTYGSLNGVSVKLNQGNQKDKLTFVTEGVETGLSVRDATDKLHDVIATLGKANFKNIEISQVTGKIVLCLDNDGKNIFTDKAINEAIKRLVDSGKQVFIAMPNKAKTDFNDLAKQGGVKAVADTLNKAITYDEWNTQAQKAIQQEQRKDQNDIGKNPSNDSAKMQQMANRLDEIDKKILIDLNKESRSTIEKPREIEKPSKVNDPSAHQKPTPIKDMERER